MSSVIRDAGEKDNKTRLSTTDNGTFFIIKKHAPFGRGTFLAFTLPLDDPAGTDRANIYFPFGFLFHHLDSLQD